VSKTHVTPLTRKVLDCKLREMKPARCSAAYSFDADKADEVNMLNCYNCSVIRLSQKHLVTLGCQVCMLALMDVYLKNRFNFLAKCGRCVVVGN
jgi:hypothetical protein